MSARRVRSQAEEQEYRKFMWKWIREEMDYLEKSGAWPANMTLTGRLDSDTRDLRIPLHGARDAKLIFPSGEVPNDR